MSGPEVEVSFNYNEHCEESLRVSLRVANALSAISKEA
jgi:hypothetical protein